MDLIFGILALFITPCLIFLILAVLIIGCVGIVNALIEWVFGEGFL